MPTLQTPEQTSEQNPQQMLQSVFGFEDFRPGQAAVVDALLAGRSALAVFPTGGGKSITYQLPALLFPPDEGVTLVVSPLIALMKDQIDFLVGKNVQAARLDSSLSLDETREIGDKLASGTLKLLYVAPERFNNERFLGQIERVPIALLAIDEAHCISEWGHNFRPDYLKLSQAAKNMRAKRVLALTATATPSVVADICQAFNITTGDSVVTGFYRPNLRLATTPVSSDKRDALLLARLQKRPPGSAIVYVTLQKTAETVAAYLTGAGLPAFAYHAGMDTDERVRVQENWKEASDGIVVATIAFGMGIDKSGVRYVYHYNLPKSLESYSQEIGRAGRDGLPATVEMLACPDDVPVLQNFAYGDTPTLDALRGVVQEVLSLGEAFSLNQLELGNRHDVRPLVLRTVLTYLELAHVIAQGTPFYAGYEFKWTPGNNPQTVLDAFPGAAGDQVKALIAHAKKGISWYKLNPDDAAQVLNLERRRVVRMLEVMQERGFVELKVADARATYTRTDPNAAPDALAQTLTERFAARENAEVFRLQQVLDLIELDACQWSALAAYFGEVRAKPCGHCTFCVTQKAQTLPPPREMPPPPVALKGEIVALKAAHPAALSDARQAARFLCGLTSPALTRAKLSRHAQFGTLADYPFAEVLAWCEA